MPKIELMRHIPHFILRRKNGEQSLKKMSTGCYEIQFNPPITIWDKIVSVTRGDGLVCDCQCVGETAENIECIKIRFRDGLTMKYVDTEFSAKLILRKRGIADLKCELPPGVFWRPDERASNWFSV